MESIKETALSAYTSTLTVAESKVLKIVPVPGATSFSPVHLAHLGTGSTSHSILSHCQPVSYLMKNKTQNLVIKN
jgi:hypothetical protein